MAASGSNLIAHLDFDGTLTLTAGEQTILHAEYKKLIVSGNFDSGTFKDEEIVVEILKAQIGSPTGLKLAPGAMDLLNQLLALNANITLISNNRREYIRGLLIASGMLKNILDERIRIVDRRDMALVSRLSHSLTLSEKYTVAKNFHEEAKGKPDIILVCDDSEDDHYAMQLAAKEIGCRTILSFNDAPGTFNFSEIISKVKTEMGISSSSTSTVVAQPPTLELKAPIITSTHQSCTSLPAIGSALAGGLIGGIAGKAIAAKYATTAIATTAATIFGVSVGTFIAASAATGAALFLAVYAIYYYKTRKTAGGPGLFSLCCGRQGADEEKVLLSESLSL